MRAKAARDLVQLSDPAFLEAVSEGLSLIIDNATRLHGGAQTLQMAKHAQGTKILNFLAEEEATKFLILIDAVRCPPQAADIRTRQLGYLYSHLARGIYATLSYACPVNFAEIERIADIERETLYLDGPNDVDWIFRNDILAQREEAMYVDYVKADDGHKWLCPRDDKLTLSFFDAPQVLKISHALHETGMTTPSGLAVVAEKWRPVNLHSELRWNDVEMKNRETLDELSRRGLLISDHGEAFRTVVERWPFPLYTLDLSPKVVDRKKLQQKQNQWLVYAAY